MTTSSGMIMKYGTPASTWDNKVSADGRSAASAARASGGIWEIAATTSPCAPGR